MLTILICSNEPQMGIVFLALQRAWRILKKSGVVCVVYFLGAPVVFALTAWIFMKPRSLEAYEFKFTAHEHWFPAYDLTFAYSTMYTRIKICAVGCKEQLHWKDSSHHFWKDPLMTKQFASLSMCFPFSVCNPMHKTTYSVLANEPFSCI